MAKYLDENGLGLVWGKIKSKFIAQNSDVESGHVAVFTVDDSGNNTIIGLADGGTVATSTHAHGNITNGGAITAAGVDIANGDALTIVDSSASGKLEKSNLTFDGSTTTQFLAKKGTWVTALTSHQSLGLIVAASASSNSESGTRGNDTTFVNLLGGGTLKDSVQFTGSGSVSVSGANGKVTITGSHQDWGLVAAGSEGTANVTTATSDPYVNLVKGATPTFDSGVQLKGSNNVTVSATSGVITISGKANTVTGSSLTANQIILGNGSSAIKASGKTIVEDTIGSDNTTVPTSKAVAAAISSATSGLSGAMHFVGTSTSTMTDGQTTNPTVSNVSSFSAGDVVVDATETEFVLGNEATPKWHKLGDANSYALSSVSITGTGALGGGGTLASNRTITHNTSALGISTDTSYGPGADVTGSNGTTIKVPQITVDKYGHITAVTERTYTSVNNTYTVNNAKLQLQGSSGNAADSGFTANGNTNTVFKFAVGTGDTISSIGVSKSSATNTITINGATMPTTLKNPNAVRLGDNTTYIDYDGSASGYQLSFTGSGVSLAKSGNVVTATITNTTYTLPIAKYDTLGGLKPAYTTTGAATGYTAASNTSTPALNARTTTAGKYYAVEADKNGVAFVNVPWTAANNAKLQVKGSASDATATDTGFTADASNAGVITFARSGASVASVTTSGGTVTINGVDSLKNPNSFTVGTKPNSTGTATNVVTYDGSASGKAIYFSTGAASTTNVQFAVNSNGFITGTVTDSGNTLNTAGSSDTSSKIFLIGATSQSSTGVTTYSHDTAYVGTDGCLYSNNGTGVGTKVMVVGDVQELTTEDINTICV